jgi:proteic killer suppression protein
MNIRFATTKLQKTLCTGKELVRQYGDKNAKKIQNRLAVLRNTPTLAQMPSTPPYRCHPLKGEYNGCFAVDIIHPFRIIFRPAHTPVPIKKDGGIDLAAITDIEILDVRNYH